MFFRRIMTQVFTFNSSTSYYSPMNVTNQETNASLLPLETVLVNIHPPILNKHRHILGVFVKNMCKSKKLILPPDLKLVNLLSHKFIVHHLVFVNCRHLTMTRAKYDRGLKTYFYLKHCFSLNNTGIQCGGISSSCLP